MLERPGTAFQAGESVRGTVAVAVQEPCRCKRLVLDLRCYLDGHAQSRTEMELFRGTWAAGEYRYPFEFPAPGEPQTYIGTLFDLRWRLAARAEIPWSQAATTDLSLSVGRTDTETPFHPSVFLKDAGLHLQWRHESLLCAVAGAGLTAFGGLMASWILIKWNLPIGLMALFLLGTGLPLLLSFAPLADALPGTPSLVECPPPKVSRIPHDGILAPRTTKSVILLILFCLWFLGLGTFALFSREMSGLLPVGVGLAMLCAALWPLLRNRFVQNRLGGFSVSVPSTAKVGQTLRCALEGESSEAKTSATLIMREFKESRRGPPPDEHRLSSTAFQARQAVLQVPPDAVASWRMGNVGVDWLVRIRVEPPRGPAWERDYSVVVEA